MKTLFVISISQPILLGIYENNKLIQMFSKEGKTSDILPCMVDEIFKKFSIEKMVYVNGPGSFMAIKVAYVFLKTLSIVKNIPLYSIDGFSCNQNSPIKALGNKYFIKVQEKIKVDIIDNSIIIEPFKLPLDLSVIKILKDSLPQYHIPAVVY